MVKNYIAIVFDGPPSHESGRFVEVNDSHGKSIDIGTWVSRGDGSWELRIAVDKLKDDNDMTVDTSREAVEAVIKRLCNMRNDSDWTFYGKPVVDTLAALLYERDRLAANRDAWVSDAMTSTTELEQRIRDLEAERDGLEDSLSARDVELQQRALRIRDLEAEVKSLDNFLHLEREAAKQNLERAERAEEQLQAIREVVTGWNGFTGLTREVLAILADTNEGNNNA